MSALIVGLATAMMIGGAFFVLAGLGEGDRRPRRRSRLVGRMAAWPKAMRVQLGLGAAGGLGVLLFTGFFPALVLVPALVVLLPGLLRNVPQPELDLLEALDRWVRLVTASVQTGKSVPDAIRATGSQVPPLLARQVSMLTARLDDRWPLADALYRMADEVDAADADAVLAALILVGERGGVGASVTLGALSDSVQDRLRALREIAAERAKPQVVVRQVTAITLVALAAAFIASPGYFAPYATPLGQLLLTAVGVAYLGSLFALRRLAVPRRRERILVRHPVIEVSHA